MTRSVILSREDGEGSRGHKRCGILRPFCFALLFCAHAYAREVRVTILHFSDYHSHAVPFYDDGRVGQGGIARATG